MNSLVNAIILANDLLEPQLFLVAWLVQADAVNGSAVSAVFHLMLRNGLGWGGVGDVNVPSTLHMVDATLC